ncbi:hypothetical protein ACOAOT_02365 [Lacrimispora sp. AGF001]|uniref:hypothetical protein n=1 Tax=Lacrimispora sp. AGF001 TaxID=3401631 RepID=UPI003B4385F9|nr:hypothetical protein [Paenibacillaceae bacterium]
MRRFKQLITMLLSVIMLLNSSALTFAGTTDISSSEKTLFEEQIKEVQDYMAEHQVGITLDEQVQTFNIPLSNGEKATVKITLTRPGYSLASSVHTAKLGTWNIDYDAKIPHSGSIKLRGTMKVTHVPDMSSSSLDCPKFSITGSSISAVPPQGYSITDKGSSYKTLQTNHEYKINGYVTYSFGGKFTSNYYVSMQLYCKTNSGSERNKIYVDTNLSV